MYRSLNSRPAARPQGQKRFCSLPPVKMRKTVANHGVFCYNIEKKIFFRENMKNDGNEHHAGDELYRG